MNKNSVLNFFEQIAKIPRNSGKESKIKDFLVDFATKRSLSFYADNFNNVIIYKNNCNCEKIILHSHIDMVCVKKPKSNFDFDKDGINLVYKNGYISAKETSLGADNGIGIAIILSLLDSDIPCNIEAVFTASEETTMQGAYNLDVKRLKGKKLICLDGFE